MNPRSMIEGGGRWVARMTRMVRMAWLARRPRSLWLACAGALGWSMLGPVVIAQTNGPAGPAAYRCGNSYSSTPCPGGNAVDTDDPRSAAQQREAQDVKRRDAALAEQLATERRARERDTVTKPAIGIGPPPATSAAQRDGAASASTKKKNKKKTGTSKPVTTRPQKLSSPR
jgi:hypothetical protein